MKKIIYLLIFIYVFFFSYVCYLKFNSYNYSDFDLAVHSQVLWNILHGSIYSSILGIDFLGNHMHLILFLIVPIYKLFSHPLTLLFLQSLALGMGAYPLYLISKEELGDLWGLGVSIIYLLYPGLGYINLFEFHPTVFAVTFLLFLFYQFKKRDFSKFLLFMVLSLLCQENISLAVIMFGIYAAIKKRSPKWIITPVLFGILYFYLSTRIIMPYFNKNKIQFFSLYSYLGDSIFKIISFILLHPIKILKIIFTKQKLIYLSRVFGPLCFLPFLSPSVLIISLPFFLQHLLSIRQTEISIYYHYLAEIIPFLFISFIYGIKRLISLSFVKKYQLALLSIILSATICFSVYLGPQVGIFLDCNLIKKDSLDIQKDRFIKYIPNDGSVIATFEFLSHLTNRKYLYSFHHMYTGLYTLSSEEYELPRSLEYALIDFNDPVTFDFFYSFGGKYDNIRNFLTREKWGVQDVVDTIVLFKKGQPDKCILYEQLSKEPQLKNKVTARIIDEVKFIGYDLDFNPRENFIHLVFGWKSLRQTSRDINIYFDLIDQNNKLIFRLFRPICYRILPTNAWQNGEFIREQRFLILPEELRPDTYILKLGFYDYKTGFILPTTSDQKNILDSEGRICLGQIKK